MDDTDVVDIAEARAKALGLTIGQFRNRDNPYMEHCPKCGAPMMHANIGRENWAYCDQCRVKHNYGSGFNAWREHNDDVTRKLNTRDLAAFYPLSTDDFFGPGHEEWFKAKREREAKRRGDATV